MVRAKNGNMNTGKMASMTILAFSSLDVLFWSSTFLSILMGFDILFSSFLSILLSFRAISFFVLFIMVFRVA